MRALVVPMAAMAETAGSSGRCRILVEGFRNAQSAVDNEAGAAMPYQELSSSKIAAVAEQLINSSEIAENAGRLENKLVSARGVNKILREMLKM